MRQDKIYHVEGDSQSFYVLVDDTGSTLKILLFEDEPSKYTSPEQAVAVIELSAETNEQRTSLLAQIWSGLALKKENSPPKPLPFVLFERDLDDHEE